MRRCVLWCVVAGAVSIAACSEEPKPRPTPVVAEAAASATSRWVRAHPPTDLALLEAPGEAVGALDGAGEVGATFRAQVRRVHVLAGTLVERGAPIVDVVAPEVVAAAAAFVGASEPLRVGEARLAQLRVLRGEGLVDASQLFDVESRVAALRADRAAALATLRAAGLATSDARRVASSGVVTLRAPVAGVVREVRGIPGEVREAGGEPYARIAGGQAVRVEVRFAVTPPEGAHFELVLADGARVAIDGPPIARVASPTDGMTTLWLALPASPNIAPRARLRVRVLPQVEQGEAPMLEVPLRAIRRETSPTGVPSALVVSQRGGVEARVQVIVRAASGASALVTSVLPNGLSDGDEVLSDAAALLDVPTSDE